MSVTHQGLGQPSTTVLHGPARGYCASSVAPTHASTTRPLTSKKGCLLCMMNASAQLVAGGGQAAARVGLLHATASSAMLALLPRTVRYVLAVRVLAPLSSHALTPPMPGRQHPCTPPARLDIALDRRNTCNTAMRCGLPFSCHPGYLSGACVWPYELTRHDRRRHFCRGILFHQTHDGRVCTQLSNSILECLPFFSL